MTPGRGEPDTASHHVVVIGGGFGGLYAAKALGRSPVRLTVVDRRNFHLFQPLLYQVATGGLSPGDIASPLRHVLKHGQNTRVWLGEVVDVDVEGHRVLLRDGVVGYDTLIVAAGARHDYFGNKAWETLAPGLKTVEDATEIRGRILWAFEMAEREQDPERRRALLTFVVIGGGPTGVELAGALGEIANDTLKRDFRSINPTEATIYLFEGAERMLSTFPAKLSTRAERSLARLGVRPRAGVVVTEVQDGGVTIRSGGRTERIPARTILWAAGVRASPLGGVLNHRTGAPLDRIGRVIVGPNLTVPGHPEIFAIGDMANFNHQAGGPLPGTAPPAMQQGRYVARLVEARLRGETLPPFRYKDRGSLATIGRASAVADIFGLRISGFFAWLVWLFVHLLYLVEFDNRLLVLIQWTYNYLTRNRGARLITGEGEKGGGLPETRS